MEVDGKYFIVEKHRRIGKKKLRRRFNEPDKMDEMTELAKKYAEERNEDFLIVQVVSEISKPEKQVISD